MAEQKKITKLGTSKQEQSKKLRTKTKMCIDKMLASGIAITKSRVCKKANVSWSFVNNEEISTYIASVQRKQAENFTDIETESTKLNRKLMAVYIF